MNHGNMRPVSADDGGYSILPKNSRPVLFMLWSHPADIAKHLKIPWPNCRVTKTVPQGFLERFFNVLCKKDVFSLTTDVFLHPAQVCYLDVLASFGWDLALHHRRFEVMGPKNREVQVNGIEIQRSQSTDDKKIKATYLVMLGGN